MQQQTVKHLADAANRLGIEAEPYHDYNGRGMRQPTSGIVIGDVADLAVLAAQAVRDLMARGDSLAVDALIPDLRTIRTDDMGKDAILY